MSKYEAPYPDKQYYTCPHCNTFSQHERSDVSILMFEASHSFQTRNILITQCFACGEESVYKWNILIYPNWNFQSPPEDLPEDIEQVYLEASSISSLSPRASAALLRKCLEMLLNYFWCTPSKKLYDKVEELKIKWEITQKVLDSCTILRKYWNDGIHSISLIDFEDDTEMLTKLVAVFHLIWHFLYEQDTVISSLQEQIS